MFFKTIIKNSSDEPYKYHKTIESVDDLTDDMFRNGTHFVIGSFYDKEEKQMVYGLNINPLYNSVKDDYISLLTLFYTTAEEAEGEWYKAKARMAKLGLLNDSLIGTAIKSKNPLTENSIHPRVYVYKGYYDPAEGAGTDYPAVDVSERDVIALYSPGKEKELFDEAQDAINQGWSDTLDLLKAGHMFTYEPYTNFRLFKP